MMFLIIVTVVSLAIALVMSAVAWRAAGEERRRSEARVAGLATDIYSADLDLRNGVADVQPVTSEGLFGVVQPTDQGGRRFAIVGGVAVLVFAAAAVILTLSSGSHVATAAHARQNDIVDTPAA